MNLRKSLKLISVSLFLFCAFGTGCAGLQNAVTEPRQAITTNQVTETRVVTNIVPVIVQVPSGVVTNFVDRVETNVITTVEVKTNTVYVARESIATGISIGQAAAPLAGPYGGAIAAGLTALSGVLGWLVKRKNGEAQSLSDQLTATVMGVERVARALPEGQGDAVKKAIATISKELGVSDALHDSVKEITKA